MALALVIGKDSKPSHEIISQTLQNLPALGQSGVCMDTPRKLWKKKYQAHKLQPVFVDREDFWVGHIFIPAEDREMLADMLQALQEELKFRRQKVLTCEVLEFNFDRIPAFPIEKLPIFVQLSGYDESGRGGNFESRLYDIKIRLEKMLAIEFISLSTRQVIYKFPVPAHELQKTFSDLADADCLSAFTLAYAGDLDANFRNWQPFSNLTLMGNVDQLPQWEHEAGLLGIKFPEDVSSAHKLGRFLEGLIQTQPVSLPEAQEMLWPTPHQEFKNLSGYFQKTLPVPAHSQHSLVVQDHECLIAIGNQAIPLYLEETSRQWILQSNPGPQSKPIHGKLAFTRNSQAFEIKDHAALNRWVLDRVSQHRNLDKLAQTFIPLEKIDFQEIDRTLKQPIQLSKPYPANPIAHLTTSELKNLSPVLLGKRPLIQPDDHPEKTLELPFPVLNEGQRIHGILRLEDLIGWFITQNPHSISFLHTAHSKDQDSRQVLKDLGEDAVKTVQNGCRIIILDDTTRFEKNMQALEPPTAIAAVAKALMAYVGKIEQNLRRSCSIVVRTGDVKSIADIQALLNAGADAVVPYTTPPSP